VKKGTKKKEKIASSDMLTPIDIEHKESSSWGQEDRVDKQILEPAPYRNAFEKIDSAIFIRSDS
jgi:hypothetical protein